MKILRYLLYPIALLYGGVTALRNFLYDQGIYKSHRVPAKVVSVGNISTGGTGKTPMAAFLLQHYSAQGVSCAYLSRGYGRKTKGYLRVDPDGESRQFGDEALQIANQFPQIPVAVCEDRVAGAEKLIADHRVELIILDDAFQHRRIARDLNILMMDANHLPWRDHLLPTGNLREARRGMQRAPLWVASKIRDTAILPELDQHFGDRPKAYTQPVFSSVEPFYAKDAPALSLEDLRGRNVILFAGLANNRYFFEQVRETGARIHGLFSFADHHNYSEADLLKILAKFAAEKAKKDNFGGPILLTTEKDHCRLAGPAYRDLLKGKPLYYLRIEMRWLAGREAFVQELNNVLQ